MGKSGSTEQEDSGSNYGHPFSTTLDSGGQFTVADAGSGGPGYRVRRKFGASQVAEALRKYLGARGHVAR